MSNAFKKSLEKISKFAAEANEGSLLQSDRPSAKLQLSATSKSLLEAMPDGISLHSENGGLLWASQTCADLLASSLSSLNGMAYMSNVNPQDKVSLLQMINHCHCGYKPEALQIRHMVSDGVTMEPRILECRATRFEMHFVMLTSRDVTDQVERMQQKEDLADAAESANRMKTSFISNISHELRTPLNAIIGFSDMLEGKAGVVFSKEAQVEYAGLINQSARHLLHLLNDLLDISKLESGKFQIIPELFDVDDLIVSTLKILDPIAAKSGVTMHASVAEGIPKVFADQRATRQILMNLLANAIKFSKRQGEIAVSVSRTARNLTISVKDNGIGMNKETIEKLGETFFQAEQSHNRRYEGTGLGISIVKALVELHGGKLTFHSEIDHGTTVNVSLPLTHAQGSAVPAEPDSSIVFLNNETSDFTHKPFSKKSMQKTG